jgi:hypothetical protein
MLQKGDKYIHFTKYGSVHKGTVDRVMETYCVDTINRVVYKKFHMINTNNVMYALDGSDGKFYRLDRELDQNECDKLSQPFGEKNYVASRILEDVDITKIKEDEEWEKIKYPPRKQVEDGWYDVVHSKRFHYFVNSLPLCKRKIKGFDYIVASGKKHSYEFKPSPHTGHCPNCIKKLEKIKS